jgi:hypothetical protein
MSEGIGSTTILTIIVVFIALVSGYMAYNVNYTKAFRMKNKIIALYEENNGICGGACQDQIVTYANEIGYRPSGQLNCNETDVKPMGIQSSYGKDVRGLYCEYKIKVDKNKAGDDVFVDTKDEYYYRILTRINIQIPIIQNIFGYGILNITGDTKSFSQ